VVVHDQLHEIGLLDTDLRAEVNPAKLHEHRRAPEIALTACHDALAVLRAKPERDVFARGNDHDAARVRSHIRACDLSTAVALSSRAI
jgi:hypothetical protein